MMGKPSFSPIVLVTSFTVLATLYLFITQTRKSEDFIGPSILDLIDDDLSHDLQKIAKNHNYTRCNASKLRPRTTLDYLDAPDFFSNIKSYPRTMGIVKGNEFLELFIQNAPCWGMSNCCESNTRLRPKVKEDTSSLQNIFQHHEYRLLYTIFANFTPKYILDAGAGIGLSTHMFRLIMPNSVIVSLESDGPTFENLFINNKLIDAVHTVHGGLWSSQTLLQQYEGTSGSHILRPVYERNTPLKIKPGNVIGFTVNDLLRMFDIPSFDYINLDLEGAESVVFGSSSNVEWISKAKIISLKLHEKLGKYYRTHKTLSIVSAALSHHGFTIVKDNDLIILMSPEVVESVKNTLHNNTDQEMEGDEAPLKSDKTM